jgi:hypothetical protein
MKLSRLFAFTVPLAVLAVLAGCATIGSAPRPEAVFVVVGEGGIASARVITTAASCPPIEVDGRSMAMAVRAPHSPIPLRGIGPTSAPVLTCEAAIPAGTAQASVAGTALSLPRANATRIVVIGDTGCRLKTPEFQDCNDPLAFPFAQVAAAAAAWKPDLVLHVGDYHYRESPCPAARPGCKDSPWGYGWEAWNADFFAPGKALLQAAPWVMGRGNHESCWRGGQGYWRFLDPRPLVPGRDCNVPANDVVGDYSDPYAVPVGGDAQVIVFDSSNTSSKGLPPGDIRREKYADTWRKIDALSRQAGYNIALDHHPLLGFGAFKDKGVATVFGGDKGLQDAFGALDAGLLPPRISMLLSGHVHLWEQVSFSSAHPTQFISGFSGCAEDTTPLPAGIPSKTPAPGAIVESMSSWINGFGFMTMQRSGPDSWNVKVWDRNGRERNACTVSGRKSACSIAQVAPESQPAPAAAAR